ncbi:MAG: HlyD family efflux transporter periplasmic adaptor subunit [Verrucomicrobia subdivision 3 bacterium]|nr:HlyD family efflux transporter periplasmic adaptor subunit [Limisphaerales bacterium]
MNSLPTIPTPLRQRLRPLRQQGLPVIVLFVVVCAIAVIWQRLARPTSFVGVVETIQTTVTSPDAGLLTNIATAPLQEIRAGDVIAEVLTTDPRTAGSRLAVLRGRMQLTELELDPILNRQRSALDYERLVVDCAQIKVELATQKVELERAKNALERDEKLFRDSLISADLYDQSLKNKEALQVGVEEKEKIVALAEKSLERLRYMADTFVPGGENDPLKAALSVEADKLRLFQAKMKPLELTAPIDGIVTIIHKRAGEQILAGEAIATITSRAASRIVGYLPQAFPINPKVGMQVEVRTRSPLSLRRACGVATITGVSPHLEPITNAVFNTTGVQPTLPLIGRLVSVSLPADLKLLPGQPLDITLLPTREPMEMLHTRTLNPQP